MIDRKTVFLIRNIAPEKFGGGEIYQLRLAAKLKDAGFTPVVLTNSDNLLEQAKTQHIQTLKPPYLKRQNISGIWNLCLPMYFLYQRRLIKWYNDVFEKYKPGVVNIQSRDDWIAATLAARRLGIKILWTDHADFYNWVLKNVNVRFKNIIGKKIIKYSKYADKVIFVSKTIEKLTRDMIYPLTIKNSIVIENGVVDKKSEYENIVPKKNSFVYCGRVVRDKGVWELVSAFEILKKKYLDAELNIYGDGDEKEIRELVKNNQMIKYHGVTDEPLRALAENECFVLPSYMEGLSLSLIEAAMMGKMIIATKVGGNVDVIEDKITGLLVEKKNIEELTTAMDEAMCEPKRVKELAKNARAKYKEMFDFDKIFAEKMLPLYNTKKEKK